MTAKFKDIMRIWVADSSDGDWCYVGGTLYVDQFDGTVWYGPF